MRGEGDAMATFQANTKSRTIKQWAVGLLVLLAGLTIAHFGVALFLLSNLGSDPFTVLVQGISRLTGLSIGTCHVGMLVLLLVIMLIFTRGYIKPGSFVCAFCGGWIIDLFLWVFSGKIGEESPLWLRIVCMVAGCIILAFGMSVVIASRSGTGPNDLVAMILSDKVGSRIHLQFRWVRLICDAIFVGLGWLLGGVVGAGTLVAVFLTGPAVQFFLPFSTRLANACIRDVPSALEKGKENIALPAAADAAQGGAEMQAATPAPEGTEDNDANAQSVTAKESADQSASPASEEAENDTPPQEK